MVKLNTMSKLDALYLSNDDFSIVSEWNCEIFLQNLSTLHEDMIVIPSSNPYSKIMINIDGLDEQILNDVYGKFCLGRAFWERLQFEPMFSMEDSTIICEIKCKQFGDMKRGLLFDNPMSSKVHQTADIKAATLDKVVIDVKFHCKNYGDAVNRADVFQLFNEYMNSLVMSQLEFKIPLVFSHTTRYRLMEHEKYIGTVSKCLDNSQTVTPSIVKIISKDKTSTTVFRILHDIVGAQKLVNKYKEHNGTTILPQVFEKTPTTAKRS